MTAAVHNPPQDGDTLKGLVWGGGKWLSPAKYREYAEKKHGLPAVTDAAHAEWEQSQGKPKGEK
jgi:hypothetical protein